jgi:hypothetical protein
MGIKNAWVLGLALGFAGATEAASLWPVSSSFVYQLQGTLKNHSQKVIFLDLFETSTSQIKSLRGKGKTVICYFSAGSAESWRSDYKQFPSRVIGKNLEGWAGERWLDVRDSSVLQVLSKRLDLAKSKGCHGVDPDNVDGYGHSTGFPLKKADAVSFLNRMATAARARGLGIGLKNASEIVGQVAKTLDWVVSEECFQYRECSAYQPFVKLGKPIFAIEYTKYSTAKCTQAKRDKMSLIFANYDLNGVVRACP